MEEQKNDINNEVSDNYFDESLDFDIEQALLRDKFKAMSVEKQWKKLDNIISKDSERIGIRRNSIKFFTIGILSGIAASIILAICLFPVNFFDKNDTFIAFMADSSPKNVTIIEKISNSNIIDSVILSDIDTSKMAFASDAIINSYEADYSKIVSNKEQVWQTITTPKGKDYKVVLNDGTKVILSAYSRITFPTSFLEKERVVILEGEAYFDVAKDSIKPFIVKSNNILTRALGTEFNVKSFNKSSTHVTLISGSVLVESEISGESLLLKPGQDVSYKDDNIIEVKDIDTDYYSNWKEGYFYFDNVPLVDVLYDIGRWYNVTIKIINPSLMSYRLHFVMNRHGSVDDVIDNLNSFGYIKVHKKDNSIIVNKKKIF
jgi:Fe2+-dicitrate sensor, membrane component